MKIILLIAISCTKNINTLNFINKDINDDLIEASINGNIETVKLLLEKGANINNKNRNGVTALMYASLNGHAEIVKLLLERGANVNDKDNNGRTALMSASMSGHKETVKLLIEKGANVNDKNSNGSTALTISARNRHIEVIKLLIEKGADVNYKDKNGVTALMYASENGHREIVKLLLERGANINDKDNYGRTALISASESAHKEVAELLLERGVNVNDKDNFGWTALMYASENGHREIVKLLLERGANVNDKDNNGRTALMIAYSYGNKEVVDILLKERVDIDNIKNIIGEILFKNMKEGNIEKSLVLINRYNNKVDFNMKDDEDNTFLHYAALLNNYTLFDIFLDNKVDKNASNKRGETPLYYALCKDNIDEKFIWYLINTECILKPNSCIKGKPLVSILLPYDKLFENLIYEPLITKLVGDKGIDYDQECKIKDIIKVLKLKEEDFDNDKNMVSFIRNVLLNNSYEIDFSNVDVSNNDNEDIELNIEVFDEIFMHFREDDYWDSIRKKGIDNAKRSFKIRLEAIRGYRPVNKALLQMSAGERLKNTNFQKKKKLSKLLRLISRTAVNGYNNDKIKYVINEILDLISCSEGTLEAINESIRYLVSEGDEDATQNVNIREVMSEELMCLRYNILKEVCKGRIKVRENGSDSIMEITPHTFPQLVKDMSQELKLKVEYLDDLDYNLTYDKNEIVGLVLKTYKERIVEYVRGRIKENKVLWNMVRNYVERQIFNEKEVLTIDNFLYDDGYKIKEETVKSLLFHLNFIK